VPPAPLFTGRGEHFAHRFPEPERAVTDREHRCGHAAAAAVAQQIGPRFGGFAVAVGDRDEFLAAISTHPDHHQQAQFGLIQPNLEVDTVDPQVDVVSAGQIALPEGVGLVLPLAGQPGNRRRRQTRT
jgi:hypothetical protein